MILSEAEAQRRRAEVHAAMVAGRYDLAHAKLQELAQRSRGTAASMTRADDDDVLIGRHLSQVLSCENAL